MTQFLEIESHLIENQNLTKSQSKTIFFGNIGNSIVKSIIKPIGDALDIYTVFIYAGYAIIFILTCCFKNLIIIWCNKIKNLLEWKTISTTLRQTSPPSINKNKRKTLVRQKRGKMNESRIDFFLSTQNAKYSIKTHKSKIPAQPFQKYRLIYDVPTHTSKHQNQRAE